MLSAKEARNKCDDKVLSFLNVNNTKYSSEINAIFKRIEEALDKEDKVIYSIDLTNEELHYVEKTNILQNLDYIITVNQTHPWGGKVSW